MSGQGSGSAGSGTHGPGNSNKNRCNNNCNWRGRNNRGNRNYNNNQNGGGGNRNNQTYQPTEHQRGNSTSEGVLGSHPSTACQICHFPGHNADVCPNRYQNRPPNPHPAFASFSAGETSDNIWFPDSAAASHMTPSEGQPHGGGSTTGS